jgi:hypothetical protein
MDNLSSLDLGVFLTDTSTFCAAMSQGNYFRAQVIPGFPYEQYEENYSAAEDLSGSVVKIPRCPPVSSQ